MAKGKKTGGRTKGTPNRKASDITAILDGLNCNPIEGLARIANGEELLCGVSTMAGFVEVKHRPTFAQRLKAYTELAEYVAAKRKAVEVSGEDGGPVAFTILIGDGDDRA
jgi:hypothetical protein